MGDPMEDVKLCPLTASGEHIWQKYPAPWTEDAIRCAVCGTQQEEIDG